MNRPDTSSLSTSATLGRRCKRQFARWLAAIAVFVAWPGAAQAETVLRIVMNSDLKILDPIWNTAFVIRDHGYMIYDTLFATDAQGEIRPQMVDKTEISADGLTYREQMGAFERNLLASTLAATSGNQSETARLLQITPRSVYNKLRRHQLSA
jgi:DNA-binding NtrC family response regulator